MRLFSCVVFVTSVFAAVELKLVYPGLLGEHFDSKTSWAPSCPKGSGKVPRYIPHPYNCRSMFLCLDGQPQEYFCPDDEVFNPDRQECGKKTKCVTENNKEWPAFESCPEDGRSHFFKHPYNCSMYYQCGNGIAFPRRCPDGLHFNPKLSVCDWPENVNCKSRYFLRRSRKEITQKPS